MTHGGGDDRYDDDDAAAADEITRETSHVRFGLEKDTGHFFRRISLQ